jgi:hypothetical protein
MKRQAIEPPLPIGRPIHSRIMQNHKYAVCRTTYVNLYEIDSKGDPFLNRSQCIFRRMAGSTTMADSQHPTHEISLTQIRCYLHIRR